MASLEILYSTLESILEVPVFEYRALYAGNEYVVIDDDLSPFSFASNSIQYEKVSRTVSIVSASPLLDAKRHELAQTLTLRGFAVSGFAGGFVEIGEYFHYYFTVRFFEEVAQ